MSRFAANVALRGRAQKCLAAINSTLTRILRGRAVLTGDVSHYISTHQSLLDRPVVPDADRFRVSVQRRTDRAAHNISMQEFANAE